MTNVAQLEETQPDVPDTDGEIDSFRTTLARPLNKAIKDFCKSGKLRHPTGTLYSKNDFLAVAADSFLKQHGVDFRVKVGNGRPG